jgi:hypothetical protein
MNGGRQLLANVLRELAPRHDIRVLALRWGDQTGDAPAGITLDERPAPTQGRFARLAGFAQSVLAREPYEPPRIVRAMLPGLARAVEEHDPDVVHLGALTLAGLGLALGGRPALITPIDAWHLNSEAAERVASGPRRLALRIESANARRYSAAAYRPFDRAVYVTQEDADEAAALDPDLRTAVVPYGMDIDHYSFGEEPRDRDLLVLTGAMHWPPNVDAARVLVEEVLPLVRLERPGARVAIVGRRPSAAVTALAETPGVVVTGGGSGARASSSARCRAGPG